MSEEPLYYVAQGEQVQGPFPHARILAWIAQGRVRRDMLFSREGGEWRPGSECPELFPPEPPPRAAVPAVPARPAAPVAPQRAADRVREAPAPRAPPSRAERRVGGRERAPRRAGRRRLPGAVLTVSTLDFVFAALQLVLALWLFRQAALLDTLDAFQRALRKLAEGEDVREIASLARTVGTVCMVLAVLNALLGFWIRSGQPAARTVHFVLSVLALLNGVWGFVSGQAGLGALLGLAVQVLILVLLAGAPASAFFAGREFVPRGAGRRRR